MSTSLLPELSYPNVAQDQILPPYRGKGTKRKPQVALTVRQQGEILRAQGEAERGTFLHHWLDLARHILPRRLRISITDVNKGNKRNEAIIDSTATEAAGTLAAGMMSGLTSPATKWFRLTVPDEDLAEQGDVKEWLHEVQTRMEAVFLRSNLYNKLPLLYADVGVFGTHAMAVMDDDEAVIRCYDFPIGTYWIANDEKMRVRTFGRTFRLTVQQIVEKWGDIDDEGVPGWLRGEETTLSRTVQQLWERNNYLAWIDICHIIRPNRSYDGDKIDAKYKKFEEFYYELGSPNQPVNVESYGLLAHNGYDEFPVLVARWETNSEDVYGTNCPGMKALGDIRQLQLHEKRAAQAVEKMVNPPLVGPSRLMNTTVTSLPGGITYDDARDESQGIRPLYQIKFDISQLEEKSAQIRNRINRVFFADLFLMLTDGPASDRRQITAREIDERHEEKLLALGPVLEQLNQDVHDPLINRTFQIMARKGLIPPPPQALVQSGANLKVEYVSIMAQAQKQTTLSGMERLASFVFQVFQADPTVLDNINVDELTERYADGNGVAPKIIRDPQEVAQIRAQRQKQQQQQQLAENIPKVAKGVKDLASAPLEGNNALTTLLGRQTARNTLGATAGPPVPVAA